MLAPNTGWVLTDRALLKTTNESTWTEINPPGTDGTRLLHAHFASTVLGWTVYQRAENLLDVFRTSDGGQSWSSPSSINTREGADVRGVQILGSAGWIMVRYPSSSNFSIGQLFRTTDGGQTWSTLAVPIADAFRFHTSVDGWLAGGPAGDKLFATHDGGATWTASSITPPPAFAAGRPAFTPPRFFDASTGLLPVSFTGANTSGYAVYGTANGGSTWTLLITFAAANELSAGSSAAPTFDVSPSGGVVLALRDRLDLRTSGDRGRSWRQLTGSGLPASPGLLSFIDNLNGWALAFASNCPQKQNCVRTGGLHSTRDGGTTWTPLQP